MFTFGYLGRLAAWLGRFGNPPVGEPTNIVWTGDKHVRRDGDDYAAALTDQLPQGVAWPRDDDSTLMRTVRGLAQIWGFVDERWSDLLERETDPRFTIEMLTDWERNFGLPDPCLSGVQTVDDRHNSLIGKMTLLGSQARGFFLDIAIDLGYQVFIEEWAPFMTGISRVGDTSVENEAAGGINDGDHMRWYLGPPENRYTWSMHVGLAQLSWFRSASGQLGVDPHLLIGIATDLECLINRWKPAHTFVSFDYSGAGTISNSMQGTP